MVCIVTLVLETAKTRHRFPSKGLSRIFRTIQWRQQFFTRLCTIVLNSSRCTNQSMLSRQHLIFLFAIFRGERFDWIKRITSIDSTANELFLFRFICGAWVSSILNPVVLVSVPIRSILSIQHVLFPQRKAVIGTEVAYVTDLRKIDTALNRRRAWTRKEIIEDVTQNHISTRLEVFRTDYTVRGRELVLHGLYSRNGFYWYIYIYILNYAGLVWHVLVLFFSFCDNGMKVKRRIQKLSEKVSRSLSLSLSKIDITVHIDFHKFCDDRSASTTRTWVFECIYLAQPPTVLHVAKDVTTPNRLFYHVKRENCFMLVFRDDYDLFCMKCHLVSL